MSTPSTNRSGSSAAEQPPSGMEAELAQARAERDAALARLDKRARRQQIGGAARRTAVIVLVVLGAILIPLTATVAWAHRTVINTTGYVNTVAPIAADPAVTSALARISTDQIFAALDPQETVSDALPPRAEFLAGPITNGVKGFIQDQANTVLASDAFQRIWVTANRTAHAELMKVLHGQSEALVTSNGQVVLSVVPLLNEVLKQVQGAVSGITGKDVVLPQLTGTELPSAACARISAALDRPLPSTCGQIPLFPADKLTQAQHAVRAFDRATLALLIVTPLLVLAALLLSRRRRRTLLQLAVATVLVMVIFRRAMIWLQDTLIDTGRPENKDARAAIIHQVLNGFFDVSVWVLVIGIVVVVAALVSGPYRWAVTSREWTGRNAVVAGRQVGNAIAGRAVAGTWVRTHVEVMQVAGGVVALLLILILNLNVAGLLVILALLALYEFWLYRLRRTAPPAPAAASVPGDGLNG